MHKYHAKKTEVDGIKFDSQVEARIYKFLKESDWDILSLQPEFLLQDKFKHEGKTIRAIKYIADFKIEKDEDIYYIDVKGMETPVFKLKHKLWLKRYGQDHTLLLVKSIKNLKEQLGIENN